MHLCQNSAVPKLVDHDHRRQELGRALWQIVAEHGLAAATVRAVAARSGWSMGAVRHYFGSQDELLAFGMVSMVEIVQARVVGVLQGQEPSLDRARLLLEELLPLDAVRLGEVRVYLAFMARARVERSWDTLRWQAWEGERRLCRWALSDVLGCPPPDGPDALLPPDAEAQVDALQAVLDGLSVIGATMPEEMTADRMRAVLDRHLQTIAASDAADGGG